ncbi:MAG: tRNA (adenosine(37)-N6)-threonylcarbamoyltransferase complex dimerization subunit type 1 TsaB [SAR116 cluster bacterium MED-G04]|jgi:tRNA threonylcarbamoyladenosine biosynthesis protein TsaB|nr:MAG: tRNA (adenosine(37)-N6)-threonylcarbamoyltransferase complex dimerization subunit type 1 TsaB [SAR116 cluster bacterium MED-G04]CAI8367798.1 MAG: tRNA threonylcarbamoyladenosine biosynthesis protein TsaB [SAR116 cluster bacterium MED-G04]HCD49698.1 tRNA (adenosine(37)-N6)-threonylcarbamoyltransferase complex dimerization subunit type 1 TsaB [Alphaproteobacteria bacterium]HCV63321.1 tRNA (adenosine(37)-N6)-threonylcarbamoyltransferase complex dimerization subunit type 1 TsaB [Alphaproteob|tara:strand:+ start:8538 stop:9209 length:672 start_codon:yes stop_codon:yes gene_type:complete
MSPVTTTPTILALEASAAVASAAIMHGTTVLAETRHDARHGHAAWMLTLARDCLNQAGLGVEAITAVLAGRGPGSFTGIRVALAAAKGFAISRGIRGHGLNSLDAMAHAALNSQHPVAALADTRRGSLFVALYHPDGRPMMPVADLPAEGVAAVLADHGHEWIITGQIGDGLAGTLKNRPIEAAFHPAQPLASHLCGLYATFTDADPAPLDPIYLSDPLLGPR